MSRELTSRQYERFLRIGEFEQAKSIYLQNMSAQERSAYDKMSPSQQRRYCKDMIIPRSESLENPQALREFWDDFFGEDFQRFDEEMKQRAIDSAKWAVTTYIP